MAAALGRTWALDAGVDFDYRDPRAPRRSAVKWAKRHRLHVTTNYDRDHDVLLVTFNAVPKPPKFDQCAHSPGLWVDCRRNERDRAASHARKFGMRAEFKGNRVRFVVPVVPTVSAFGIDRDPV